jgi:hypothetical protein
MTNKYGNNIDDLPEFKLAQGVFPGVTCKGCGYKFEHVQPRMLVAVAVFTQDVVACKHCMSFKIPRYRFNNTIRGAV